MARFILNRQLLKGKAPGSYIFIGEQKMDAPHIRIIRYSDKEYEDFQVDEINQIPRPEENKVLWVNIDGMHDAELLEKVGTRYEIPNLLMEDVMNTDHRPGVYFEQGRIRVIMKSLFLKEDRQRFDSEQISFVLLPGLLLTFQERTGDYFQPVRERLQNKSGKIRSAGPDYLMYALMDTLADLYLLTNEFIGDNVENMEERVLTDINKDTLEEIYRTKMEIRFLRKHIKPVREIAQQLIRARSPLITERTYAYLADLDILLTSSVETLDIYYQMNTDQLNIYQTNVSNKSNDVMKVLAVFASIFIPLTFIAGIYGTNFKHIPELEWENGYFYMLGFMALVALAMLYYFKRKNWF